MLFPSPRVRLPRECLRLRLRFPSVAVVNLCAGLLFLAAAPAAGCTGTIGNPIGDVKNTNGVDGVGNPSTGPTGGGTGGATGGPATTGGGTGTGVNLLVGTSVIHRLTRTEYANTVRDLLGASRKFAIALLDYFDHTGFTTRVGDLRRLRGRPS